MPMYALSSSVYRVELAQMVSLMTFLMVVPLLSGMALTLTIPSLDLMPSTTALPPAPQN